jgi:hypothetical protein
MHITRRDAVASLLLAAALPPRLRAEEAQPLALGRPHTDFIPSQLAPSRVLGASNSQPGVTGTPLSYDAKGTRAVTVVFRFPANWSMTRPHYVNSDQEFLVLDGELEINGERYRTGDYAYLPAGFAHQSRSSGPGATLINFYEGEHLAFYEPTPAGMYKPEKLIRRLATKNMRWTRAKDMALTSLGPNVRQKLLRHDAATGEHTWLVEVAADPAGQREPQRSKVIHAAVEESFVLRGEVATPRGTMRSGAYVWRAPGQPRGPYGSRTGYQLLIRSKGGALATTISGAMENVTWSAPYEPQISAAMRNFAFGTIDPNKPY